MYIKKGADTPTFMSTPFTNLKNLSSSWQI